MKPGDFRASIVITSYNQKHYLIEAIESVINQTVRVHEIIIADDHSTDGSVELIQDYIARYPGWIKAVFQRENVGIPKNRNAALRQVLGDYVAILDGDDRFLPYKLERELEALQKHLQARCVYSNVRLINSEGQPTGVRYQKNQPSGDVFAYVARGMFGLPRSMLMDYALLREIGFMDEGFPKYDGFDLTLRLAKRCQFVYVPEPLVEYRVHSASDSKGLEASDHLHDLEAIYEKMLPWLSDLPVVETEEIVKTWYLRLLRFRVRDALERGNRFKAYWMILLEMVKGQVSLQDWRQMLTLVVPISSLETIKSLRSQLRVGGKIT